MSKVILKIVGFCFLFWIKFSTAGNVYDVLKYQAVGDGMTDDSEAFLKAWNAACADQSNPTLLIPWGKSFVISKSTRFEGPCKSAINVKIDGNIMAPNKIWTTEKATLITLHNINNLYVVGQGTIDGQGAIWWDCFRQHNCNRPYLINFESCNNLMIRNVNFKNGPSRYSYQSGFDGCKNLTVIGITVIAPGNSPNTDGINIAASQNVEITGSTFATGISFLGKNFSDLENPDQGDDCIAILGGTSNVTINEITCGPGHGISIGSLGEGGTNAAVEKIHLSDCNIFQTMTGVRIKTWQGGLGYVRDVTFERIKVTQVQTPIQIDQFYPDVSPESALAISDVKFMDIHGTSTKTVAIRLDCSEEVPCTELFFEDINLTRDGGDGTVVATSNNAHGTTNGTITPPIPLLRNSEGK